MNIINNKQSYLLCVISGALVCFENSSEHSRLRQDLDYIVYLQDALILVVLL